MKETPLANRSIGISISESADMPALGLAPEHLDDAMSEIARHVLACGASLAYGGDLREGGFTELLFEIVERYRSRKDEERVLVQNYLAWPVHAQQPPDKLASLVDAMSGLADLILLTPDGRPMRLSERSAAARSIDEGEWSFGLTAMRNIMAQSIFARIVLGGRTSGYRGNMPGIAEEALIQLRNRSPLYVLGGFGGCSLAIVRAFGLANEGAFRKQNTFPALEQFGQYKAEDLRNGLSLSENRVLMNTVHIDEAVALILRGLLKLSRERKGEARR